MARDGAPHFSVVIAERQTGGRGRLKRSWHSEAGGLYFTLILRPEIPLAESHRLNFLASFILAQTLSDLFAVDARVKWPNDILIDGKKLSGMLSELESEAEMVSFLNISIGINVNNDPTQVEPNATSLRRLLGKEVSRRLLLASFLDAFEDKYRTVSLDQVIPEWKKWSCTLHRPVRIVTFKETSEGVAVDVDENGGLILQLPDGARKTVTFGDCFHQCDLSLGAPEEAASR
jgi:BirA family biotin operon repressor/biotin-[acetyl-CoA-carboxylase] ligase